METESSDSQILSDFNPNWMFIKKKVLPHYDVCFLAAPCTWNFQVKGYSLKKDK